MAELQLRKDHSDDALHSGGSVTYRVFDGDCWVGWVGDGRKFNGSRYTGRKWWACWREDGDTAARWSTGLRFTSRADAVDGLAHRIAGGIDAKPEFGYERRYQDLTVAIESWTNMVRDRLGDAAVDAYHPLVGQLETGRYKGLREALYLLHIRTQGEFGVDADEIPDRPPAAAGGGAS